MTPDTEPVPEWLAQWRVTQLDPKPPTEAKPKPRKRKPKPKNKGFIEPKPWDCDGGSRREPVLDTDHTPPLVVRYVGWQRCLVCQSPFFSEDVTRLRLCVRCKTPERDQRKPLR